MKKILLGFALLTVTVATNAQDGFSKGNIFMTGSVGISSTNEKNTDTKTSDFSVSPAVGYFVSDNIAVGLGVGIGSSKETTGSTTNSESSTMTVGAFGRYYFTPKSKFSMFGHLGLNYGSEDDKKNKIKTNETAFFVAPGFNYFISNKLSLEAVIGRIGYSSSKTDVTGDKGSTGFDFGLDLSSVAFGINYKF